MTTLLVSIYDGMTNCSAALVNTVGEVEPQNFSKNIFRMICDVKYIRPDTVDEEEVKTLNRYKCFVDTYDSIIICEDGNIIKVK